MIRHEHLHRYAICLELVRGRDVLDIASGEGYGTAMLAGTARSVVGIDIAAEAVEYSRRRYYHANVRFLVGDCAAIPLADASVDVVVSFETIEHHGRHDEMMAEFRRVLRPGGVLVISSPNRLVYSDEPNFHNPFHVKELYFDEFAGLLQRHFGHIALHGQRIAAASFVYPLGATQDGPVMPYVGTVERIEQRLTSLKSPVYFVAICSNDASKVEHVRSLFIDAEDDLLRMLESEREHLAMQLRDLSRHVHDGNALPAPGTIPMLPADAGRNVAESVYRPEQDAARHGDSAELHASLELLKAELESERALSSTLYAQLERVHAEREQLAAGAESREAELVQLRAANETLVQERSALASVNDALAQERSALASANDALAEERSALAADRDGRRTELDGLRARIQAVQEHQDALAAERDALRTETEELRRRLTSGVATETEAASLRAELALADDRVRHQAAMLQARNAEFEGLERRAERQTRSISAMLEDEELLRGELRAMTGELRVAQIAAAEAAARLGEVTGSRAWRLANYLRGGSRQPS